MQRTAADEGMAGAGQHPPESDHQAAPSARVAEVACTPVSEPTRGDDAAAPVEKLGANGAATSEASAPLPLDMPGLSPPRVEAPVPALAFWRRSLLLGGLVAILGALTLWERSTVPDKPASPVVTIATAVPGAPPLEAPTSAALRRVRSGLSSNDPDALSKFVDVDGLIVAPFTGGVPESGYAIPDPLAFLKDTMAGSRPAGLGWRTDSRGRILVLTEGWRGRPLRLSPNSTLELSPLVCLVLQSRNGEWSLRWLLIDATGTLTQQARSLTWQAIP